MKKFVILLACAAAFAACSDDQGGKQDDPPKPIVMDAAEQATASGLFDFAFDAFKTVCEKDKNVVYSPLSAQMGLAMLANGAEGETLQEILDAMCPDGSLQAMNSLSTKLIETLPATDAKSRVSISNSAWHDNAVAFLPAFESTLDGSFDALAMAFDFNNKSKAAADVNEWVKKHTAGRISELISEKHVAPAMLLNALYFKAEWKNKFDEKNTRRDTFHNSDGTTSSTDFMGNTTSATVFRQYGAPAMTVELAFGNEAFVMTLIMPQNEATVAEALEYVQENWPAISSKSFEERISIRMPRFKIQATHDMTKKLEALGIKRAFDTEQAQISKMTSNAGYIANVLQKCEIEVDEEGATAAASTSIGNLYTENMPFLYKFDHPFAYMIRETSSGTILFMGVFNRV